MRRGWVVFFLGLHIVTAIFLLSLILDFHFVDPSLLNDLRKSSDRDVLNVAVQIGRLDFVSAILAMFGILTGLAAIFGFIEVRNRAEDRARITAIEIAGKIARSEAREEVRRSLPAIVAREMLSGRAKFFSEESASDSDTQNLMSKLDEGGESK